MRPAYPFRPITGAQSTTLSVSTSSNRVAIPSNPMQVRLSTNGADAVCFVEFGDSSVTAAASTGMRMGPGSIEVFSIPLGATHVAAITASGSATLYVTPGAGA
jgi:hypothetical protein